MTARSWARNVLEAGEEKKKQTKQKGKKKHAATLGTKYVFIYMRSRGQVRVQAVGGHEKCSIRTGEKMCHETRSPVWFIFLNLRSSAPPVA